jgi:hypothetical protein
MCRKRKHGSTPMVVHCEHILTRTSTSPTLQLWFPTLILTQFLESLLKSVCPAET